ncbi:hypothetical protein EB093_09435 [bacterium]|nr:hypothetical protein [bacterium]
MSATSTEVPPTKEVMSATSTEVPPTKEVMSATSTEVPTGSVFTIKTSSDNASKETDLLTQVIDGVGSAAQAVVNTVGSVVTTVGENIGLVEPTPENKTPESKIGGGKKSKKHSKK